MPYAGALTVLTDDDFIRLFLCLWGTSLTRGAKCAVYRKFEHFSIAHRVCRCHLAGKINADIIKKLTPLCWCHAGSGRHYFTKIFSLLHLYEALSMNFSEQSAPHLFPVFQKTQHIIRETKKFPTHCVSVQKVGNFLFLANSLNRCIFNQIN